MDDEHGVKVFADKAAETATVVIYAIAGVASGLAWILGAPLWVVPVVFFALSVAGTVNTRLGNISLQLRLIQIALKDRVIGRARERE